jgi:hypothetical protein
VPGWHFSTLSMAVGPKVVEKGPENLFFAPLVPGRGIRELALGTPIVVSDSCFATLVMTVEQRQGNLFFAPLLAGRGI